MDFHVITPRGTELVAQVVEDKLVIVPPPEKAPALDAGPVQPTHGI